MIKIQNIYYMLAYAFQILKSDAYSFCETEEFENAADLLAAILEKGTYSNDYRRLYKAFKLP